MLVKHKDNKKGNTRMTKENLTNSTKDVKKTFKGTNVGTRKCLEG